MTDPATGDAYQAFLEEAGPRLERALIAAYGLEVGTEAFQEAIVVGWERWETLAVMANPAGYLYRVGQTRARSHVRWVSRRRAFSESLSDVGVVAAASDERFLDAVSALGHLRREHRVAVLMVRAWGFTYSETAAVLDVSEAAVANYVRRGMAALRTTLEVSRDAR